MASVKRFARLFLVPVLLTCFWCGCKKEEEVGTEYFEFKLDGKQYKVQVDDEVFSQYLSFGDTQYIIGSGTGPKNKFARRKFVNVSLIVKCFGPELNPGSYSHHSEELEEVLFGLGVGLVTQSSYKAYGNNGEQPFSIRIIKAGQNGDYIEGTFEFSNLNMYNRNEEFVSGGHNITDGKFRAKIE